ncbi:MULTISPECIES: hypothetical protein [Elizabethkingia]|nr:MULTISPECIES: hypothetical protein [Elizabethkingia]MDX8576815.1 hypothetical protein [Elizabethkingia sp. HX WYD]
MKQILLFLMISIPAVAFAQRIFIGKVTDENGNAIPHAFIININTNENLLADEYGVFSIKAKPGQEIRVVSGRFERQGKILREDDFKQNQVFKLLPHIQEIEGVNIGYRPTGHLETDLGKMQRDKELAELKNKIRMALNMKSDPNEIRPVLRTPSAFSNQTSLNGASIDMVKVINLFKGKSKKEKYKKDPTTRLIENVGFIYRNVGTMFFESLGIPKNKVSDFIVFVLKKNSLEKELKEQDYNAIRDVMRENVTPFLDELTKKV